MTGKRFRKEQIKGTGMQFIVDETTRKENSNGSVGYKAYSTTDMTCDELVDLLNALHEERNYFERKKEEFLSKWSIAHTENIQLRQENEELKQDNDIKFWKLQLIEQWNETELISHELYLAIENGYEISDKFKKYLDGLKKKHEEHMKKAERLGI